MHESQRWHWSLILHKALLGRSCYSVLLQLILKRTMRRFRFSSRRLQRSKSDNVDIGTGYIYLIDIIMIIKEIHLFLIDVAPKDLHLKIGTNEVNVRSLNSCPDHDTLSQSKILFDINRGFKAQKRIVFLQLETKI